MGIMKEGNAVTLAPPPALRRQTGLTTVRRAMRSAAAMTLLVALCLPASSFRARAASPALIDYPMFNFNSMRTGINPAERILTPGTVGRLKRLWAVQLDGV